MDYSNYQINDFLEDDSFVQWVLDPGTESPWMHFGTTYPDKVLLMKQAQTLILAINKAEQGERHLANRQAIWQQIGLQIEDSTIDARILPFWQRPSWRWAAALLLITGFTGWIFNSRNEKSSLITYTELVETAQQKNPDIREIRAEDNRRMVRLEDGSLVVLEKGSRLSYPLHFAPGRREVFLTGEAFFEVAKNPNRPFFVFANEVVTKVLGTSFNITAFANAQQVLVKVQTGQVSVYKQSRIDLADPETQGLILLPNQQAIFDRQKESLNRRLVEAPLPVAPLTQTVGRKFEDVSTVVVLTELERLYGVEIRYNQDVLIDCILTTTLRGESLYDELDIICQTIGATYKEIDAQLIIESKGCH